MPLNKKVHASDTLVLPKVKVESFSSDSASSPGFVPIGGMVTVMPNIDAVNAWQPPASGVIKDGFMMADGTAITSGHVTSGCKLAVGTILPNMTQKYPRGNTTSGTTGGNNLYTPAGTNSTSNVPASGLSFSGSPTSYSVSVPGHSHGMTASSTLAVSISHDHVAESFTSGGVSANHTHGGTTNAGGSTDSYGHAYARLSSSLFYGPLPASGTGTGIQEAGTHAHSFTTGNQSVDHTHTTSVNLSAFSGSSTPSGRIGLVTGGQNGDAAFTASGNNTPSGSITGTATAAAQTFIGTQASNEPAYVEVIWVIRVS